MGRFIYAFKKSDKEQLIANGFALIKSDDQKNIYVFENNSKQCFSLNELQIVYSDTMTF